MADQRIYKTEDGRHVPEGHPEAAFLAFSQFEKPPKAVLDELEELDKPKAKKPEDLGKKTAPADKQRTPSDK
jgi:hypothetical protein